MPSTSSSKKTSKMTAMSIDQPVPVEEGSGNVFADLGVPQPELVLAKAILVQRIRDSIASRKLTQAKAAKLLGLDQPKISALVRGRTEGYSLDRLFKLLNLLGQEVKITVRPATKNSTAAGKLVVLR